MKQEHQDKIRFAKKWSYYFMIYFVIAVLSLAAFGAFITGVAVLVNTFGPPAVLISMLVIVFFAFLASLAGKTTSEEITKENELSERMVKALKKDY